MLARLKRVGLDLLERQVEQLDGGWGVPDAVKDTARPQCSLRTFLGDLCSSSGH
jgi:hypothetical protein